MGSPLTSGGTWRARCLPALLLLGAVHPAWAAPALRWHSDPEAPARASVEAALPPGFVPPAGEARLRELLSVRIGSSTPNPALPPMAGAYTIEGSLLRFQPRFPLEAGLTYHATLRLGTDEAPALLTAEFAVPRAEPGPRTNVAAITPTADVLPFNLLKFYIHFTAPMTRGEAYRAIVLRDKEGRRIEDPFLELPEELWNTEMTRLTILLDPGRIKRGLLPHEIVGAVLEEGQEYTLSVDPEWMDAAGQPLERRGEKSFRSGPADYTQPDPATWQIETPPAGTRDALRIRFGEPLDAALVARLITVFEESGAQVTGEPTTSDAERTWVFTPTQAWKRSTHHLHLDHRIEDLAGNSIERRFEEGLDRHPEAAGAPPGSSVRVFTPGASGAEEAE